MTENCWLERRVIGYAHQGGAREAPSSTLYAIERAISLGLPAIELDVHATADRQLVVCHDPTLDRTTGRPGAIKDLSLEELMAFDNAYFFVEGVDVVDDLPDEEYRYRGRAPADHRFGVASLAEILESFPDAVLNLDIKKTAPEVEPYEELLADLLRHYDRRDDVIVASFDDTATDAFSRYAPEIGTSAGTAATAAFFHFVHQGGELPESVSRHVALQVPATYGEIVVVDEAFVEAAHRSGLAVHVWTVNDRDEMEQLLDLGVDGIITDEPSVLQGLLGEKGVAWRP